MPAVVERVVGMHNYVPEANTDKVWAGVVVRLDTHRYQFVALNGRRAGSMRPSPQPPTTSPSSAYTKFETMHREKLAHGYREIDWTQNRYGLLQSIAALGGIPESVINTRPWDDDQPLPATVANLPRKTPPVEPPAEAPIEPQIRRARTLDF